MEQDPKKFEEKQYLEKPAVQPQALPQDGVHIWEEDVQLNCTVPGCNSTKHIKVERSNVPGDPTAIWVNDLKKLGRCHDCLDSMITNMTDSPEDEELYYIEWSGYIGNKFNKCTCGDCVAANPGRRFVSAAERTLTKLWKEKGYTDEEIEKKIAARAARKAELEWKPDPNKTHMENMEIWASKQQEDLEKAQLALQERNKLFKDAVDKGEFSKNQIDGKFEKHESKKEEK